MPAHNEILEMAASYTICFVAESHSDLHSTMGKPVNAVTIFDYLRFVSVSRLLAK